MSTARTNTEDNAEFIGPLPPGHLIDGDLSPIINDVTSASDSDLNSASCSFNALIWFRVAAEGASETGGAFSKVSSFLFRVASCEAKLR